MGLRKHPFSQEHSHFTDQINEIQTFCDFRRTHLVNNRGEIKADFGFRLRVVCFMPSSVHVKALKLFHNFSIKWPWPKTLEHILEDTRMWRILKVVKRITYHWKQFKEIDNIVQKVENVSLHFLSKSSDNIVGNQNFLFFSFFIHADSNFWGTHRGPLGKHVLEFDRSPESTAYKFNPLVLRNTQASC